MATQLTIVHRIANAFNNIGLKNGTKIPEPEYTGEDKSNSVRDSWLNQWTIAAEYVVARTLKGIAEKREKDAKAKLIQAFGAVIANLKVGDTNSVARGNVVITFNLRNGPTTIDKAAIVSILTTEYKWKLDDIQAFVSKIEKQGTALWITPSTTAE